MPNIHFKQTFIRDAVHKNINISEPVIKALVGCKEFQRLRWISQLGGAQIAFPSATHTRFGHSLGVYHILNRVLNEVTGSEQISNEEKISIKIAGLLHDLGHGPFSHSFEKILNLNNVSKHQFTHEQYSCDIIKDSNTEINSILKQFKIDVDTIIGIIKKNYLNHPKYQIQLVSSQLDCDRIDYLMRDGYFTGVDFGSIDLEWIITSMIIDVKVGLTFSQKAISAIENYLITRFHMYSQVYYHKSGIVFDSYLQQLFSRLTTLHNDKNYNFAINVDEFMPIFIGNKINITTYLSWTDATIIKLLQDIILLEQDSVLLDIAKTILFCHEWQEQVDSLKINVTTTDKGFKRRLNNVLYDFTKDPILIKTTNGNYVPLEKLSQILQSPTKIQTTTYFLKKNSSYY
ncbi:HD domain-containing protein [Spiroplasma sp. AdecLV25b]|uniref:HD domain-containing protein n=1 Tax=Spiroplasma sp. AdecLV25b TaxID=3027162 RepID=UPI0027E0BFB8|nr:HD domain-containing protein [Spiroplasma sp. AdecLV25b]